MWQPPVRVARSSFWSTSREDGLRYPQGTWSYFQLWRRRVRLQRWQRRGSRRFAKLVAIIQSNGTGNRVTFRTWRGAHLTAAAINTDQAEFHDASSDVKEDEADDIWMQLNGYRLIQMLRSSIASSLFRQCINNLWKFQIEFMCLMPYRPIQQKLMENS